MSCTLYLVPCTVVAFADCFASEIWVGRSSSCQVTLPHKSFKDVSKKHCRIFLSSGIPFIEDRSFNGTWLNNERLVHGQPKLIEDNSSLALCKKKPLRRVETSVHELQGLKSLMDKSAQNTSFEPEVTASRIVFNGNRTKVFVVRIFCGSNLMPPGFIGLRRLGCGICAEVHLAYGPESLNLVALKCIQKKNSGALVKREVEILKSVCHPCIVRLDGVVETDLAVHLVLEYVPGGDLFKLIKTRTWLDEYTSGIIFYQLALALQYLHNKGIVHRDVKPANVLLCSAEQGACLIKVSDFGLSRVLGPSNWLSTLCGTFLYAAPEVLGNGSHPRYSSPVDLWAAGVTLYACLFGRLPFLGEEEELRMAINQGWDGVSRVSRTTVNEGPKVSDDALDLLSKLLVVNPDNRLTSTDALAHCWLQKSEIPETVAGLMAPWKPPAPNFSQEAFSQSAAGECSLEPGEQVPMEDEHNPEQD
uniref:non-specific serine/threonine protein kinase n=1 Tax=Eptatretus burgeri TaxID=7764 RepID=A0A8C4QII9_EPTBU